jgi:TonB family protein
MKLNHFFMIPMFGLASTIFAQHAEQLAPQRIERSEAIAMNNLSSVVDPKYPGEVKIDGKVILMIVIDTKGKVIEARLVEGHPALVSATLDAVKQWKFRPYVLNNQPVEVVTTATVEYKADPPSVVTPKPHNILKMRVSQGVLDGNLIHQVAPDYPIEAKDRQIQGDVILLVTVSREGNVANLKAMQGDPVLVKAAIDAAKQWKYRPFLLNGEPIELESTIKIQFRLSK